MSGLPQPSRWKARLPATTTGTAALPTATRIHLPGHLHRVPPPVAAWAGEATLTAIGAAVAIAEFTGVGLLDAVGGAAALAGFTAEGTLSEVQNEGIAEFVGEGILSAPAIAVAAAQFTGIGTLSAPAVTVATAAFTGIGSLTATGYPTTTAAFTGAGTLSAAGSSFSPSGMYKDGTAQSWRLSGAWANITGWVANTATYPGSSVTSDRLVVQSIKTDATVTAVVPWTGGSSGTRTIRLVDQTGAVIATGTGTSTSPATVTATNVDLTSITSIGVQMTSNLFSGGGSVATGTGTYLTIT